MSLVQCQQFINCEVASFADLCMQVINIYTVKLPILAANNVYVPQIKMILRYRSLCFYCK